LIFEIKVDFNPLIFLILLSRTWVNYGWFGAVILFVRDYLCDLEEMYADQMRVR